MAPKVPVTPQRRHAQRGARLAIITMENRAELRRDYILGATGAENGRNIFFRAFGFIQARSTP